MEEASAAPGASAVLPETCRTISFTLPAHATAAQPRERTQGALHARQPRLVSRAHLNATSSVLYPSHHGMPPRHPDGEERRQNATIRVLSRTRLHQEESGSSA